MGSKFWDLGALDFWIRDKMWDLKSENFGASYSEV